MGCQEAFKAKLKERGFRLTPQREIVLDVMHEMDGHVTAEEVYARVQSVAPAVDISTVYRTLELLQELGLAATTDLGDGQVRYELLSVGGPHHHMRCTVCGRVVRVEPSEVQPLLQTLANAHGFAIDTQHLMISGICSACQRKRDRVPSEGPGLWSS